MTPRTFLTALILIASASASGCSKKTDDDADAGVDGGTSTCSIDENSTATVVSVVNRSESAACPDLNPDVISGGDGCPGDCAPQVDVDQCSFEVSCRVAGADIEGSGSVSGDEVTVSVTATFALGTNSIQCKYDITGRVE